MVLSQRIAGFVLSFGTCSSFQWSPCVALQVNKDTHYILTFMFNAKPRGLDEKFPNSQKTPWDALVEFWSFAKVMKIIYRLLKKETGVTETNLWACPGLQAQRFKEVYESW